MLNEEGMQALTPNTIVELGAFCKKLEAYRFVSSEEKYRSALLYTVQKVSRSVGYAGRRRSGYRASKEVLNAGF